MIMNVWWFTPVTPQGDSACIGIVKVRTKNASTNEFEDKYYIGSGLGRNEEADTKFIAEHGMPIDLSRIR